MEYTALAIEILIFCPPDKFAPFSPISIKSPPKKEWKSFSNSHILTICWYRSSSYSLLNNILPLMVSFIIQGVWGTYDIEPFIIILEEFELFKISKLFKIAFNKQVLPEPISPTIPIKSPYSTFKVIFINNGRVTLYSNRNEFSWLDSIIELESSLKDIINELSFSLSFSLSSLSFSIFKLSSSLLLCVLIFTVLFFNLLIFIEVLINLLDELKYFFCLNLGFSIFGKPFSEKVSKFLLLILLIPNLLSIFTFFWFFIPLSLSSNEISSNSFSSFSLFVVVFLSSLFSISSSNISSFIIPKSKPSIIIEYFVSLSLFCLIWFLLHSLLNKKVSNLFKDIIESKRPDIYSGNKNSGSPNELKIYKEVKILLILISEDKNEWAKIDTRLVILLVDNEIALIKNVKFCNFLR